MLHKSAKTMVFQKNVILSVITNTITYLCFWKRFPYILYCTYLPHHVVTRLCRIEDHHQRAAPLVQAAGRGDDADDLLPDGVRAVRAAGLHGGAEEQVRAEPGRAQRRELL